MAKGRVQATKNNETQQKQAAARARRVDVLCLGLFSGVEPAEWQDRTERNRCAGSSPRHQRANLAYLSNAGQRNATGAMTSAGDEHSRQDRVWFVCVRGVHFGVVTIGIVDGGGPIVMGQQQERQHHYRCSG